MLIDHGRVRSLESIKTFPTHVNSQNRKFHSHLKYLCNKKDSRKESEMSCMSIDTLSDNEAGAVRDIAVSTAKLNFPFGKFVKLTT